MIEDFINNILTRSYALEVSSKSPYIFYEWQYIDSEIRKSMSEDYCMQIVDDFCSTSSASDSNYYVNISDDENENENEIDSDIDMSCYVSFLKNDIKYLTTELIPELKEIYSKNDEIIEEILETCSDVLAKGSDYYEGINEYLEDEHEMKDIVSDWSNISESEKKKWNGYYKELIEDFVNAMYWDFNSLYRDIMEYFESEIQARQEILDDLSKTYPEYVL